jgi:hypothetical protein
MTLPPFDLLLDGLGTSGAVFVLGAGASMPDVPTIDRIPLIVARSLALLSDFPASPIPDSPLRRLISPLIAAAETTSSLEKWKLGAVTSATVAAVIEETIAQAHWHRLPQYDVFRLLPPDSTVISFNWDGLAAARCPQRKVIHPHGALRPRSLLPGGFGELLDYTQMDDGLSSRTWLLPNLVMPGEEEGQQLRAMREDVLHAWLNAPAVVVIGYRFGLGAASAYDQVWWESFIAAMQQNQQASVHIISPDARDLTGEIVQAVGRSVNVHPWPFKWNLLAQVLLTDAAAGRYHDIAQLRQHSASIRQRYIQLGDTATEM